VPVAVDFAATPAALATRFPLLEVDRRYFTLHSEGRMKRLIDTSTLRAPLSALLVVVILLILPL
jgi:hypothetical protein